MLSGGIITDIEAEASPIAGCGAVSSCFSGNGRTGFGVVISWIVECILIGECSLYREHPSSDPLLRNSGLVLTIHLLQFGSQAQHRLCVQLGHSGFVHAKDFSDFFHR